MFYVRRRRTTASKRKQFEIICSDVLNKVIEEIEEEAEHQDMPVNRKNKDERGVFVL